MGAQSGVRVDKYATLGSLPMNRVRDFNLTMIVIALLKTHCALCRRIGSLVIFFSAPNWEKSTIDIQQMSLQIHAQTDTSPGDYSIEFATRKWSAKFRKGSTLMYDFEI